MSLKKRATKSIALALVGVTITAPMLNTVQAMEIDNNASILNNEDVSINIIEDTEQQKIVEVIEGDIKYISKFDKINNIIELESIKDNRTINKEVVNINDVEVVDSQERATESLGCRFSKLRYSINMKSWTITNSKGSVKKKPETVSHKEYLYRFRDAVKASRRSENAALVTMDAAKISAIMGAITSASGVGAVIAAVTAVGGTVATAYNLWDSIVEKREADRYFAIL